MNPLVKKDILNILEQAISIIQKEELFRLRPLSDQVVKNAAVFQDQYSITIAVTIYALSKVYKEGKSIDKFVLPHLQRARQFLADGNLNKYQNEIKHIIKDIAEKDEKTKFYIEEVLERAQIKKASKLFEHGISMGQVADALGVSMWELMDYVGKTRIVDKFQYKSKVMDKLAYTRSLFR